jgi:hypothetical protein
MWAGDDVDDAEAAPIEGGGDRKNRAQGPPISIKNRGVEKQQAQ